MWFSVVYTLIDNDILHHSGQNVVESLHSHDFLIIKKSLVTWIA